MVADEGVEISVPEATLLALAPEGVAAALLAALLLAMPGDAVSRGVREGKTVAEEVSVPPCVSLGRPERVAGGEREARREAVRAALSLAAPLAVDAALLVMLPAAGEGLARLLGVPPSPLAAPPLPLADGLRDVAGDTDGEEEARGEEEGELDMLGLEETRAVTLCVALAEGSAVAL